MSLLCNLLKNPKTSGAGITIAITSTVHFVYACIHKNMTELDATTTITSLATGIGLCLAGDASSSATKEEVQTVADAANVSNTGPVKRVVVVDAGLS